MNKEVDLSKYQIRTDLAIEELENNSKLEGVICKNAKYDGVKITKVILEENNELNKKKGTYITLEFEDITDSDNSNKVSKALIKVLKDILKLNFKKRYVLEFAETLLRKPKKIKSILNIINNAAIQERISLKIRYEQFLKNQDTVFELMRQGYKITVILDNSFEPSFKNIESLQMFEFVIINRNLKQYDEIMSNRENIKNIIEI